jgi:hypothetical protein
MITDKRWMVFLVWRKGCHFILSWTNYVLMLGVSVLWLCCSSLFHLLLFSPANLPVLSTVVVILNLVLDYPRTVPCCVSDVIRKVFMISIGLSRRFGGREHFYTNVSIIA